MDLIKPFDPKALISALEAKGLQDAERIVTSDILPVFFDWCNSSIKMEGQIGIIMVPVLEILEEKALDALDAEFGIKPV